MKYTKQQRIIHCREQIFNNSIIIANKSKANIRLMKELKKIMNELPLEKKLRYDKELASNNWKKTNYYLKGKKQL